VDEKNDQIALRRIIAGLEILRNDERNSNSPETGEVLAAMTERQEKSVESGVPAAHVITIPNGNHFFFLSNETECLRAVQAFLPKLSQPN
jgi:hypothetical protein